MLYYKLCLVLQVNVPDDDLIYDIVSSIKKLSIFSDLHNFIDDKMLESFQMEVDKCRNGLTENCLPSEVCAILNNI